jgi:hypothetical protein
MRSTYHATLSSLALPVIGPIGSPIGLSRCLRLPVRMPLAAGEVARDCETRPLPSSLKGGVSLVSTHLDIVKWESDRSCLSRRFIAACQALPVKLPPSSTRLSNENGSCRSILTKGGAMHAEQYAAYGMLTEVLRSSQICRHGRLRIWVPEGYL